MKTLKNLLKRPMWVSILIGIVITILLVSGVIGDIPLFQKAAGVFLAIAVGWTIGWFCIGIYGLWKYDVDKAGAVVFSLFLIGGLIALILLT